MNQEVLKKLVKIFSNQQNILKKLAQISEFDDEPIAHRDPVDMDMVPSDFAEKLQQYKDLRDQSQRSHWAKRDFQMTLSQLQRLADGDESTWTELGEYFPNWGPDDVRALLMKLGP